MKTSLIAIALLASMGCATSSTLKVESTPACKRELFCKKEVNGKCTEVKLTLAGSCELNATGLNEVEI